MSNLSYSLVKKKNELINRRKKMKQYLKALLVPFTISVLLGVYIVSSLDKFIYYLFPFFSVSDSISPQARTIDMLILIIFSVLTAVTYAIYIYFIKLKDQYNNLRKNVIGIVNTGLCNCNIPCSCKDDFIKEMENEDIDLIFEDNVNQYF